MQSGSGPWIPDKQILEICHCRHETILLTPNSSCEACSDFTRVAARRIAQPPEAAFVTRLWLEKEYPQIKAMAKKQGADIYFGDG
jgi:hypothetical protein